jgi:hypothetical protein
MAVWTRQPKNASQVFLQLFEISCSRPQSQKEVISDLKGENQFFVKRDTGVSMIDLRREIYNRL